jgi:hypothetical protein
MTQPMTQPMTRSLILLISALLLTAPLTADELLQLTIQPIVRAADGNTASALVVVRNKTAEDLTDIDVDLVLSSAGKSVTLSGPSCTNSAPQNVHCEMPLIHGGSFATVVATFDGAKEGRFSLTGTATAKAGATTLTSTYTEHAIYEREVAIANTADAGPGSLRAAIDYANDICARDHVPCALRFRFTDALPAQGWYTIRPATPLPAITAPDISIERAFEEPKVELDGSQLATGHGLQLRGAGPATIDGLSIGRFPWDGIAITRSGVATSIQTCAIGVRPNGEPSPNGSRGVTIDPPASDVYILSNRISGNVRSGVFIAGGEHITISGNVIGAHVFETTFNPLLGNGAAGIFAGPAARDVLIGTNYLGANAAGITIARGARGVHAGNNWIDSNNGLRIDHNLDGFSGYTKPSEFALPPPRLESATYDPVTQKVTIHGTFDAPEAGTAWRLTLTPDSIGIWPEKSLDQFEFTGTTFTVTFATFGSNSFSAIVSSAAPTDWSTSEFSDPIAVTR